MAAGVDWEAFISSISDPDTNPADLIAKVISDVVARNAEVSADITDPEKRADFDAFAAKTVSELETKLLSFQSSFDEIQTARRLLKPQIDAQIDVVVTQSVRELEDL